MRELREFRAHHGEFVAAGLGVAGVCRDDVAANRHWTERLELPYPILSDADGVLGRSLGVLRSLRVGGWSVEFLRRATLLAGTDGRLAAVWTNVRIRGHAAQVLEVARGAPPGRTAGATTS